MRPRKSSLVLKFLKSFAIIFIIGNIFVIDILLYKQNDQQKENVSIIQPIATTDTNQSLEKTQEQLNSLQTKVNNLSTNLTITPDQSAALPIQANVVKEYYIPFGSGSSQATQWSFVPGLQTYINSAAYPHMKSVAFEVGGHTPTGNQIVWVQLYNITNNHPVWNSTVSWTGGGSQYVISGPITLDNGNTLYGVQMNTQVGSQSFIDQAKVHIVLY